MEQTRRKPPWYYLTISRLTGYKRNTDRIDYLQKELRFTGPKTTPGYSLQPHGTGTTDATGDMATNVGDKHNELLQLQRDVELINYAVSMLSEQKQLIIKTRYLTEGGQDKGASITLSNHARRFKWKARNYRTYERLRDEAIEEIAGIIGISTIEIQ